MLPVPDALIALAAFVWAVVLLLPCQPWRTREVLEAGDDAAEAGDITVLIPARNEAALLSQTLRALKHQGSDLQVVLIDDQSTDATAAIAGQSGLGHLTVISGAPLPEGWSGKMWALHQGLEYVRTPLVLLLDADIELMPGMLAGLRSKLFKGNLNMVSLMAVLPMCGFWERLLLPAFVYFFKLIYPFGLANSPHSRIAAAAGGCVLLRRDVLQSAGGFAAIRDAVIDDCALARRIKDEAGGIWIGLTHGACSQRRCQRLADIVDMVARTAYTQLRHSLFLLFLCSLMLVTLFILPVLSLPGPAPHSWFAVPVWLAMSATYLPTLGYYGRSPAWALLLPVIGGIYLAATWLSAWRYWRGERTRWKGRSYARLKRAGVEP